MEPRLLECFQIVFGIWTLKDNSADCSAHFVSFLSMENFKDTDGSLENVILVNVS